MKFLSILCLLPALLVPTGQSLHAAESQKEVNLYSARKENLIKPLLTLFTRQTGIKVNLVTGKADALLKRLQSEGENSPADILLTTDAGRLHRAKQAGVLVKTDSTKLAMAVPEIYRDSDGTWFGLSLRARIPVYAKDRIKAGEISSYADLADPKWKGKICVRSSDNIYNQSLVAAMIAQNGEEKTEAWAKGFVANFARPPAGGDRDQVKAVAAGQCDIALINTYYLASMLNSKNPAQQHTASQVAIVWPDQDGKGTHVNVSGAGITKSAKHPENALKLLEFLADDTAQQWYADSNYEYPVKQGVETGELLKSWGTFKADTLSLEKLGEFNPNAVKLMDRAGWR